MEIVERVRLLCKEKGIAGVGFDIQRCPWLLKSSENKGIPRFRVFIVVHGCPRFSPHVVPTALKKAPPKRGEKGRVFKEGGVQLTEVSSSGIFEGALYSLVM